MHKLFSLYLSYREKVLNVKRWAGFRAQKKVLERKSELRHEESTNTQLRRVVSGCEEIQPSVTDRARLSSVNRRQLRVDYLGGRFTLTGRKWFTTKAWTWKSSAKRWYRGVNYFGACTVHRISEFQGFQVRFQGFQGFWAEFLGFQGF